jgi:hypothetical protein
LIILGLSQSVSADSNQAQSTSRVQQLSAHSVTSQPRLEGGKTLSEREALNELLALVAKAPRPDGDTQGWPIALPSDWCPCDEASLKALLIEIRDRIGLPSCDCDTVFNCLCAIKALVEAGGASNIEVIASTVDIIESYVEEINSKIDTLDVTAILQVQSTLDECCTTMNSKMDVLDAEVGAIDGTVNVIDDKVDFLGGSIGDVLVETSVIESLIDDCCFTSNSKLDVVIDSLASIQADVSSIDNELQHISGSHIDQFVSSFEVLISMSDDLLITLSSISEIAIQVEESLSNLEEILSELSAVDAHIGTLSSTLDECCFTMGSKLDVIDTEVGVINGTVNIIDDKVDYLGTSIGDVLAETSVIESQLDECCFTVNSKLDVIDAEVGVINGTVNIIDDKVDLLGTSIGDVLVDTSIIDSKLDVIDTEIGVINGTVNIIDDKVDYLGTSIGDVLVETSVIESLIDSCCYTTNSKLDVIIEQGESILEGLNVVVDVQAIESIVDNISSVLDECCFTSNSKLDILLDDSFTIESKIDLILVGAACEPTPITSADSVNNIVTLANSGNYCLSSDLTATVVITANNVTLCLNNRQLTGLIDISGSQALIKNGVVLATGDDSSQPVIRINAGATSTIISNVSATAQNATAGAGRDALAITANNVFVEKGILTSGSAVTGAGGHGIHCISPCQKAVIRFVDIIGTGSGTGDDGGDGIRIDSGCSSIEIRGCTISNTGISSGGNAGIAINDQHAALPANYSSVILNNMAYDIANTSTVYEIRNLGAPGPSQGVSITVGTPGLYDNVYLP